MLALELRFLTGRFHATPWARHVNEGAVEWPPSPWRLVRALVSCWKRLGSPFPEGLLVELLRALAEPPLFCLPPSSRGHTRHYVPTNDGRRLMLDAFVAVDGPLQWCWPDVALSAEQEKRLDVLLNALGYFGRAESLCEMRRVSAVGEVNARPLDEESASELTARLVRLLCATPEVELEDVLTSTYELRLRGAPRPAGSRWSVYRLEEVAPEMSEPSPVLFATYLLRASVAREETLPLAAAVRQGLLSLGEGSPTFLGKDELGPRRDGHRHLHVLPWSQGAEVTRVELWAPEGFGAEELQTLAELRVVTLGRRRVPLILWEVGDAELGRARVWRSRTPFLCFRHPKPNGRDSLEAQVKQECVWRGLPEPEVERLPAEEVRYRLKRGRGAEASPCAPEWLRLTFPEEVRGPLCLGLSSHFGMGCFAPEGG